MKSVVDVRCRVNGRDLELRIPVRMTVAELLRDELRLTGTKVSCELQVCGVCTVLVDGHPVSACSMLACDLHLTSVTTIEGLADGSTLHPVQEAFCDANALQCGFCTPGFVMMSVALLELTPDPDRESIREWLDGNLCRCTGYAPIEDAVIAASQALAAVRGAVATADGTGSDV